MSSDVDAGRVTDGGDAPPLLVAEHLVKGYPVGGRSFLHRSRQVLHAVDGVSLVVTRGETMGLVGETGCGKSTLARLLAGLDRPTSGRVRFEGQDWSALDRTGSRALRRSVQMVFQDPYGSLNPRRHVGAILAEPLAIYRVGTRQDRRRRVHELLEVVGLSPEHYGRFPADLSGGQRQRIGIARALALRPDLIICDEPVSSLDISVRAQIVNLLRDLQDDLGLTYLFIAHDLSLVRHVSDRVAVMYLGRVVEAGPVEEIFGRARHPYTAALLSASLPAAPSRGSPRPGRVILAGEVPSPVEPPAGCRFHPRCPRAAPVCTVEDPMLEVKLRDDRRHVTACHFPVDAGDALAAVWSPAKPPATGPRIAPARRADRTPAPPTPAGTEGVPPDSGARVPTSVGASWRLAWARMRRDRVTMASLVFIVVLALVATVAPLLTALIGHGPASQYPNTGLDLFGHPVGPSTRFLLGTDQEGRDVLSRLIYGTRIALEVGVGATALAFSVGMVVGMAAGYYGGWVDASLSRLMDVLLSFPILLLALALIARFGPSLGLVLVVIAVFAWPYIGRLVRGQVIALREREFVEAARSGGAGGLRIMFVELIPNVLGLAVVYATLLIPVNIVVEATLSYLGLGVQPPSPSWGNMIADAQSGDLFTVAWWLLLFPCLALFLTTLAFNLVGDGLRDALDPRGGRGRLD